ncbi:MAG: aldo/keto reductase [Phycisphaerae bacterium]
MALKRCGDSDLWLPPLGVGCWAYGGGGYWGAQSQEDVNRVVRGAVERGYGFFDTAEVYNEGASERALGLALREIPREKVTICTKISPLHLAVGKAVESCEASLRRLGTDYVDLYMVHWPVTASSIRHFGEGPVCIPPVAESFGVLERLRKAGKVRYLGVSNFGVRRLVEVIEAGIPVVVNELPYGLLNRAIEYEILPFCRERGIGVLGYMALLQGVLSDRYERPTEVPEPRRRTRHFDSVSNPLCRHGMRGAEREMADAVQQIRALARRMETTTTDLALRWAMHAEGITSCLCGSRNLPALEENVRAAEACPLSQEAKEELDRITRPLKEALGKSFDYYEHPANDRTE